MIIEGNQLHIKCSVQVAHLARESPEIIIQKDKAIVATSKQNKEAVYSVMALVEHSGHYTCKVESNRISKASSILVNITGRRTEGQGWQVTGAQEATVARHSSTCLSCQHLGR